MSAITYAFLSLDVELGTVDFNVEVLLDPLDILLHFSALFFKPANLGLVLDLVILRKEAPLGLQLVQLLLADEELLHAFLLGCGQLLDFLLVVLELVAHIYISHNCIS